MKTHSRFLALCLCLMGALPGCSKNETSDAPKTNAPATNTAVAPAPVTIPLDIIAYGGTAPLESALGELSTLINTVLPFSSLSDMAAALLQGEANLTSVAAFDRKQPIRFALANPKKYQNGSIVLVGVTSPDAFVATLPEIEKKKDDQGNQYSYLKVETSNRPVYVNFINNFAVFTREVTLFQDFKPFLEQLTKSNMKGLGSLSVDFDHFLQAYENKTSLALTPIRRSIKNFHGLLNQVGLDSRNIVAAAGLALPHLSSAEFSLTAEAEGLQINASLGFKEAEKPLELLGFLKQLKAQPHDLLKKVPEKAPFFLSLSMGGVDFSSLEESFKTAFVDAGEAKVPGLTEKYQAKRDTFLGGLKSFDGQAVFTAFPQAEGDKASTVFVLAHATDGGKLETALTEVANMVSDPALAPLYSVPLAYTASAGKVGDVDMHRVIGTLTDDQRHKMSTRLANLTSSKSELTVDFAQKDGLLAFSLLDNAERSAARMDEIFKRQNGLDQSAMAKRALNQAVPNSFAILTFNPIEAARQIVADTPIAEILKDINSQTGLTISAAGEEKTLHMRLDLPMEPLKAAWSAFEKFKSTF